jgi:hypothetical protein
VLGSLLYMETASVKLSIPPQKLVATATLSGGPASGDLKTQRIDATVTQAQGGTAGMVQVGPTFATGKVTFSCTSCNLTVDAGTLVTSSKSLGYATQAAATVTGAHPATVAVRATATGAAWNTAAGTITEFSDSGRYPGVRVTNSAAIVGGSDVHTVQMIQPSDLEAVRSALAAKVADALGAALKAKSVDMTYIADGSPVLTVITDHKVGDQVSTFTMTMTGTIGATAFSDSDARALMRSALEAKVPSGQQLTNDPLDITWQVQRSTPNGTLTVNGTAIGYISPALSTNTLRARIRGLSPSEARKTLERAVPGSTVTIRISPVAVPWLPLIADHISVNVEVQAAKR